MEGKIKQIKVENRKTNTKLLRKKVGENNKAFKGKVKGIKNKEGRVQENSNKNISIYGKNTLKTSYGL